MKNLLIRREQPKDHREVFHLVELAFKGMEHADGDEQHLVERLRNSEAFIPELSMVAEADGEIAGHILFTRIQIVSETSSYESLSLAPVSVHPDYQNQGIGSGLIKEGHIQAAKMGFSSVVVVGHENYYPRFGYDLCSKFGLILPFDLPDENCMVRELFPGSLKGVSGKVVFSKEFF